MKFIHFTVRVSQFSKWKRLMLADKEAQHKAGLALIALWRCERNKDRAFFIMEARDKKKALAFIAPGRSAKSKKAAGVLKFEWEFVRNEKIA